MTELRQKQPRVEFPEYLAWIRKQGCACGCRSAPPSDAAHIRSGSMIHGKRATGMAEKPSDGWVLPLRHDHHMAQHDFGSELEWWSAHGINPFDLAMLYRVEYLAEAGPEKLLSLARKPKRTAKIASRGFGKQKRKFR
jgi:hypothetical protein